MDHAITMYFDNGNNNTIQDLHWQASYQFDLALKLKWTENVLNGNKVREIEMEVLLCKTLEAQKQTVMWES